MVTITPWIERKFEFDFPLGIYPCLLERIRFTPLRMLKIVAPVDEATLTNKPEGKWSIKEHVGHLTDVEELWNRRLEQFLLGENELVAADMSNQKTDDANHNEKEIQELVHNFTVVRTKFIGKIENLTEREIGFTAEHPRLKKPMRLIDMIYFIAEHDDNELALMRMKSMLSI